MSDPPPGGPPTSGTLPDDENAPGWAAPPRADPPPAPFPTHQADPTLATVRGGRRRKTGAGTFVVFAIVALSRLFFAGSDSHHVSTPRLPTRDPGVAVEGRALTADEVCALVRPGQLREIYGVGFEPGEPGPDAGAAGGEPSDPSGFGGSCVWVATDHAAGSLQVQILSIGPLVGDDANATYEALRPSSPAQAFDDSSGIGDEAFFLVSFSAGAAVPTDSMTVRSGGVILNLTASAATEPAGGLDSLAEVARIAVDDIPPTL